MFLKCAEKKDFKYKKVYVHVEKTHNLNETKNGNLL